MGQEEIATVGRTGDFASRPFSTEEAARALDSVIDGLRMLGRFAGRDEDEVASTRDLDQLAEDARIGMPNCLARNRRVAYGASFLGRARERALPHGEPSAAASRVVDPVILAALRSRVAADGAVTLLRVAMAAEMTASCGPDADNPLRGVIELYEMGALLTSSDDGTPELTLDGGEQRRLEWTGGMLSRDAAGRLRPVTGARQQRAMEMAF